MIVRQLVLRHSELDDRESRFHPQLLRTSGRFLTPWAQSKPCLRAFAIKGYDLAPRLGSSLFESQPAVAQMEHSQGSPAIETGGEVRHIADYEFDPIIRGYHAFQHQRIIIPCFSYLHSSWLSMLCV